VRIRGLRDSVLYRSGYVEEAVERVGGLAVRWTREGERFRLVPTGRDTWRKRKGGRLVPAAVCWHAHGWFLLELLQMVEKVGLEVRVDTALGRIESLGDLARLVREGQPEGETCECPPEETERLLAEVEKEVTE